MTREEMFYGNLANEIIARACKDYATAYLGLSIPEGSVQRYYGDKKFRAALEKEEKKLKRQLVHGSPEHTKFEVEWFFKSDWFQDLSGGRVDVDRLLKETIISTIDDILWKLEQASSINNRASLTLKIETPKERENISFPLPPILADACFNTLRRRGKELRKEAQELSKGHTPMVTRKVLK